MIESGESGDSRDRQPGRAAGSHPSCPSAWTAVAGYTDGALWYVPTRAAYEEGGYEVNEACRVTPEAGELIVERTVALLDQLFTVQRRTPGVNSRTARMLQP